MSGQPAYCPKCGAPRDSAAAFCSKCGASFTGASTTPGVGAQPYVAPREHRREKGEKNEKQREKGEKPEKGRGDLRGPVIGGGILIWLGLLVYFQQTGVIVGGDFGGLFLMGVGVLLVLGGLIGKTTTGWPLMGFIIGGAVAIFVGLGALRGFNYLGPFVGAVLLVVLGLLVIFLAVSARRRSPPPTP